MKKNKKYSNLPDITFKNADKIEYRIVWKEPRKSYKASGLCDSPDSKKPEIWVDPNLEEKRFLEVLAEEMCHAHMWDKNEKTVRRFAFNLKKILYKLGWSRKIKK